LAGGSRVTDCGDDGLHGGAPGGDGSVSFSYIIPASSE